MALPTSVRLGGEPGVQYVLRLADTCLILSHRLSQWCGHAPVLEEDIAMTNIALDLVGQARALLSHAGQMGDPKYDEDQLAFLREERDYRNITLVELPRGDFGFTMLRTAMVATFLKLLWQRLAPSCDPELAAIAGKAFKEARYHQQHAADWVIRLGDGTPESQRRMAAALVQLWPYTHELFDSDAIDEQAAQTGLGPRWCDLQPAWLAEMGLILRPAGLTTPAETGFRSAGKQGVHSEHMGFILSELQYLQRAYPGGAW